MTGFIRITLALALLTTLAACETAKGFVRDSQNVGSEIADEI